MALVHTPRLSFFLVVLFACAARDAAACTCSGGTPLCEVFWKTPVVFSGEVLDVTRDPPSSERQFLMARRVRFRVDKVWRGNVPGEVDVYTGSGGGDCGYHFIGGVQYLIYASDRGGVLATSICHRTQPLSAAKEDLAYFETAFRPAGAGRIFGKVEHQRTVPDTGERPASGYTVTLSSAGRQPRRTTTAADGRYEFADVPAGTYTVEVAVSPGERSGGERKAELADPRGCAAVDFWIEPLPRDIPPLTVPLARPGGRQ